MAEAPAPVDQAQPAEISGGADAFQETAVDSYNARAVMDGGGQAFSGVEMSSSTEDVGDGQEQNELSDDSSADVTMEQGNGGGEEPQPDLIESDGLKDRAGHNEGEDINPSDRDESSPGSMDDESPESAQPKSEEQDVSEAEDLNPPQDANSTEIPQKDVPGEQETNNQLEDKNQPQTQAPDGDKVKPHKLKYDPEKEKELARRQMMNPHYFLPTDFSKYFDVRTGQGPKQPLESPIARANRSIDELKAWRRKVEEQSPLVYNRKVRK